MCRVTADCTTVLVHYYCLHWVRSLCQFQCCNQCHVHAQNDLLPAFGLHKMRMAITDVNVGMLACLHKECACIINSHFKCLAVHISTKFPHLGLPIHTRSGDFLHNWCFSADSCSIWKYTPNHTGRDWVLEFRPVKSCVHIMILW